MINERSSHEFCKDDVSMIENYSKAIADTTQTWHLHHRDEVRVLPSGMIAYRSRQELIENGRYFGCPANELIFLTKSEHQRLHATGKTLSPERCDKLKASWRGRHHSAEVRQKLSDAVKVYWQMKKAKEE